jgi:hypothetical protein
MVLALVATGCGSDNVWIHVDNGGKERIVVTVDGEQETAIAPGQFGTIECEPGKKKLRVESGRTTLYAGTKDLKQSDKWGVGRRYFFNPDHRNRYVIYTVKYGGSSALEGLVKAGLEQVAGVKKSEFQAAYEQLAAELEPLPSDSWFEVPDHVLVLQSAPEFVVSSGGSERRRVMTRVSVKDYDVIDRARHNKNPTSRDYETLFDSVEKVLSEAP